MSSKEYRGFGMTTCMKQKCSGETAQSDFAGLAQPNRFKSTSLRLDSFRFRRYEAADPSSALQLPGREK